MATAAKLRMGHLRKENNKLEQDIADMESILNHQKTRLASDPSIRSQISKATGTSKWLSGAKGQLSGYRTHKALPQNHDLFEKNFKDSTKSIPRSRSAGDVNGKRGRTQSYTGISHSREELVVDETTSKGEDRMKVSGSRETLKAASRVKSAPVSQNTSSNKGRDAHHQRALSHQGGVKVNSLVGQRSSRSNSMTHSSGKPLGSGERKVSFDLSDEEESVLGFTDDPTLIHREAIIRTSARDKPIGHSVKTQDTGSYSERIAHLKAKVIAKASANLKPDLLTKLSKEKQAQHTNTVSRTQSPNTERNNTNTARSSGRNSSRSSEPIRNKKPEDRLPKNKAVAKESMRKRASQQKVMIKKDQRGTTHVQHEVVPDINYEVETPLDASVELWLSSLNLEDLRNCRNAFRRNNVTMETLVILRETDLIQMGITTEKSIHEITQGVKKVNQMQKSSPRTVNSNDEGTSENSLSYFFYEGQHVDDGKLGESLAMKNSSPPSTSSTPVVSSAKFSDDPHIQNQNFTTPKISNNAKSSNKTDSQEYSVFEEDQRVDSTENFVSSGDNREDVSAKNSGNPKDFKVVQVKRSKTLSANVVNRTLTSGVQSAMTKLKQKQEQELSAQKRQDRLRKAKKAERDKMAEQHAKRLREREQERLEQMHLEEGEENEGGDEESSPEASATFRSQDEGRDGSLPMKISIQGGALLNANKPRDPNTTLSSSDEISTVQYPKGTPEERLKDLELNIQGVQDRDSPTTSPVQVELLQQQLTSLKRDLAAAARATSASADPVRTASRPQSATKSSGPARGVYSSMSKNELMKEVRKQKEQHKKQIRLMESELSRLKHRDPVRNCELPEDDIHYRESDTIGEGTFSHVFHGYFNGSEVAIKRLKIPLAASDHNYFAEEVSLLHELRHPRVVLLLGVCTSGQLPLMVLEFMAGGSLYARIHDKSREYLDHIAYYQISRDIALGMNYLHRHRPQVLHLDMKSMNILLGSHGRAKIGDFGFAKLRHEAEAVQKGKIQGTPAWMAPELMENTSSSITDKVDVYSFGIILWEMLTCEQPFSGLSVFQVLEKVQQKKRPEIPQTCPEPLKHLIKSCWDHKPNKRPSFKDILIALEALSFPPEWRSLLSAANIPREAMEDPTSARSIIALVNGSVQMTQRELDKLALATHERAAEIGAEGRENKTEVQASERRESLSDSSTVSDNDIDEDSLEDWSNQKFDQRPDDESKLESSRRLKSPEGIEDRQLPTHPKDLMRSPRQHKDAVPSTSRHGVPPPPPPPVEQFLETLAAWETKRTKPPNTSTRNPEQKLVPPSRHRQEIGRASLEPSMFLAQRKTLKATEAGPHPSQLPNLVDLDEHRITSIAEILKKAVASRRSALREDVHSLEHPSSESLWSTTSDAC
ncbi:dual specificity protein kinase splB-like [Asterias rubens]|uniref:dual specificity protein kinase splB-like n=1 Tax=Asterias rubens TaxID=7604 RepID=UPI001455D289|nr:dual specificity protein kinase splB-like [Asterias rubens]